MTTFFIITVIIGLISASALYFSRHEPLCNGYQVRWRSYVTGAPVRIIDAKDDPRTVGDVTKPYRALLCERPARAEG